MRRLEVLELAEGAVPVRVRHHRSVVLVVGAVGLDDQGPQLGDASGRIGRHRRSRPDHTARPGQGLSGSRQRLRAGSANVPRGVILSRLPLHPLLLAAFAVLSVYAENLTEVLPVDLGGPFGPLGLALLAAAALLVICSLVLRDWRRGAIVATAGVVVFAFFGRLAPELLGIGLSEHRQLVAWAVLVVGAIVFALRAKRRAADRHPDAQPVHAHPAGHDPVDHRALRVQPGRRQVHPTRLMPAGRSPRRGCPNRDIYLIVLDRYGSQWSLEHRFGITDNDLPGWLADQGFQVVPGARANYRATDFSLSSMLSMQMLDEYSIDPGRDSGDRTPPASRLERPAVAAFLKDNGYTYYQLGSWYGADPDQRARRRDPVVGACTPSSSRCSASRPSCRPSTGSSAYPRAAKATSSATRPGPARALPVPAAPAAAVRARAASSCSRTSCCRTRRTCSTPTATSSTQDDRARRSRRRDLYADQLAFANSQVQEAPSPRSSRVRPRRTPSSWSWATKARSCAATSTASIRSIRRLGIRFGVLGAYYLPDQPADFFPADHTSVNTFRGILSAYFGADLPPLPDRSFDWPDNQHIYDFHDITDQLPLPGSSAHPDGLDMPPMDTVDSRRTCGIRRTGGTRRPERVALRRGPAGWAAPAAGTASAAPPPPGSTRHFFGSCEGCRADRSRRRPRMTAGRGSPPPGGSQGRDQAHHPQDRDPEARPDRRRPPGAPPGPLGRACARRSGPGRSHDPQSCTATCRPRTRPRADHAPATCRPRTRPVPTTHPPHG